MPAIATCPRCESDHTGWSPGELVHCGICNTQFTFTPPRPNHASQLGGLLRRLFHRIETGEHVRSLVMNGPKFQLNHDQPLHSTSDGVAFGMVDDEGNEYAVRVIAR